MLLSALLSGLKKIQLSTHLQLTSTFTLLPSSPSLSARLKGLWALFRSCGAAAEVTCSFPVQPWQLDLSITELAKEDYLWNTACPIGFEQFKLHATSQTKQPNFSSLAKQFPFARASAAASPPPFRPSSFAQDPAAFFQCFNLGPLLPTTVSHPLLLMPCNSVLLTFLCHWLLALSDVFVPTTPACSWFLPLSAPELPLSHFLSNLSPSTGFSAFQWMHLLILFIAHKCLHSLLPQ